MRAENECSEVEEVVGIVLYKQISWWNSLLFINLQTLFTEVTFSTKCVPYLTMSQRSGNCLVKQLKAQSVNWLCSCVHAFWAEFEGAKPLHCHIWGDWSHLPPPFLSATVMWKLYTKKLWLEIVNLYLQPQLVC